jgi:hypothetical protein
MGGKSLGYKIKYIDPLPGRKLKRPMYEIKPGHWVTKSRVPEHKAKHWHHNNKWNNKEYGYIMNLYSGSLKEFKKGRHGKGIPVLLEFTKKTWWGHWLKQKKKYGMYCPYSKVLMTTIRGLSKGKSGAKRVLTNISKDQIWPGRGYTPMNLIFCTVKFNLDKGSITPDGCDAVGDIHKERMDDWAKEIALKKELRKVDGTPFIGKELKKLKKSLSPVEYKRFLDITYQRVRVERKANARS